MNLKYASPAELDFLVPEVTHLQRQASDPQASVWIGAAAGTGKTKVLTDRLLRLLLEGCPPPKILCLTFTKAAAAEMSARLHHHLEKWATLPEASLKEALKDLTGQDPTFSLLEKGKALFYEVLSTPLKIQTLHSFCQTLLRRFPLEAGISPHFPVMDDLQAQEVFHQALRAVYEKALKNPESSLNQGLHYLLSFSEAGFIPKLLSHPHCRTFWEQESHWAENNFDPLSGLLAHILNLPPQGLSLDFASQISYDEALHHQCLLSPDRKEKDLRQVAETFLTSSEASWIKKGTIIQQWLEGDLSLRSSLHPAYESLFLKQDGLPLKNLLPAALRKTFPSLLSVMQEEALLLSTYRRHQAALRVGRASLALLIVSWDVQKAYTALKENALDYQDLILLTRRLLEKAEAREWVKYKLDGGLDHILVDEAQDTSLTQWQIITSLCEEFFAGQGIRDPEALCRSLFVVGDYKQSIYSFQGADPETFCQMHPYFEKKVKDTGQAWHPLQFQVSFRSLSPILQVVDKVFEDPTLTPGVLPPNEKLTSYAFRAEAGGLVEVWPLVPRSEPLSQEKELQPWASPLPDPRPESRERKLAHLISDHLQQWFEEGRLLTSKQRPLHPGDILILVRRRSSFVPALVSELKKRQIPVAGVDRLVLTQQLAVLDLLALAQCLLLPQDDLTLATVLRSPLLNLSEEDLFSLAYDRGSFSLWERLKEKAPTSIPFQRAWDKLSSWKGFLKKNLSPHDFFSLVLLEERKPLVRRLGPEAQDVLNEFLEVALEYEQTQPLSMVHFLEWLSHQTLEIKRDLSSHHQVRIMTAHGSKGLQSPVVFLADTVTPPTLMKEPLSPVSLDLLARLWGEVDTEPLSFSPFSSKNHLPLYSPGGWEDHLPMGPLREAQKAKAWEEYHRLLYVALTRAEDELYITGWEGSHGPQKDCWYSLCQKAVSHLGEELPFPSLITEEGIPLRKWSYRR